MQYKGGFCVLDWHAAALLICPSTLFHIVVDFCHLRLSKVEEIEEIRYETTASNTRAVRRWCTCAMHGQS